jgi:DNA-binding protein
MAENEAERKQESKPAEGKAEKQPQKTVTEKKDAPQAEVQEQTPTQTGENATPVRMAPSNHIYIGKKPVMSYAMSALIQLTHSGEIVLRARGLSISRAVDVAEIVTKRLGNGAYDIRDIKIDTEKLGTGDEIRSVSTIDIVVGKK